MNYLVGKAKRLLARSRLSSAEYWTQVNVTGHRKFATADESLDYFHWRNDQYVHYLDMMPVSGRDGQVVLDFGCGPGHDLVGFGVFSQPQRLIGMDVSGTSLAEAKTRLQLHDIHAEFIHIDERSARLPLPDASVDYVHTSGVLHHIADVQPVFSELRRVIKSDGEMRVMVYNFDSIFVHLYVAYLTQIVAERYSTESLRKAFRHMTDGPDCPVSNVYQPSEFGELGRQAGFSVEHLGNAVSVFELSLLPQRFDAIADQRLEQSHREFLLSLEFDQAGLPRHAGQYAGVDGCYRLCPS